MTKTSRIGFAVVMLLAAVSCQRRPLNEPNELVQVRVVVNVDAVNNITQNIYNENIPIPTISTDMMRVMLYNPASKNVVSQSFISSKTYNEKGEEVLSGTLNISHGTFDMIVYNFDTPTTQVLSESNENEALAYTNPIPESLKSKYALSKADDPGYEISVNYEPDHFVVAREHELRVSPHDSILVIRTTAHTIIDTYYLQIHVEGMQYAAAATAVISGLSPSNLFGLDERTEQPSAAVCFDLLKSTDKNIPGENKDVLCALFNTFGKIADVDSDLLVTFNVTDTAGNLLQYDFDLNSVFKTEDAIERHWLLLDQTIVIPNPSPGPNPSNGGFQPVVDDWEVQYGEIAL